MKLLKVALLVSLLSLVACGEKTEEETFAVQEAKHAKEKEQYANDYIDNLNILLEKRKQRVKEYTQQAAKAENPTNRKAIEVKIESEKRFIAKLTAQIAAKRVNN